MWISETWEGQIRFSLKGARELFCEDSPYQHVQIVESEAFGRVLLLDGIFQTSVADEHLYHEPIVHPLMTMAESVARVLIVGGGDGGTAREVLRYAGVERVHMCEIDELVVRACQEHLPELGAGAWEDPRLSLTFADAVAHVREADAGSYDAIIVDGSDPVGPGEGLFGPAFFAECARILRPGGLYVMQSGSPYLTPDTFFATVRALRAAFGDAAPFFGSVPLYASGPWSWTLAGARVLPEQFEAQRTAPFEDALRYYNAQVHRAGFAQPAYVARGLSAR